MITFHFICISHSILTFLEMCLYFFLIIFIQLLSLFRKNNLFLIFYSSKYAE